MKKATKESFIEKANQIWNNKFDYSEVEYKGSLVDIKVICPIHGEFTIKPQWHLQKSQCPECSKLVRKQAMTKFNQESKRLSNEDWILKAKKVHGDKFDYSKTNYVNSTTRVTIICPDHGEQVMLPHHHTKGYGCPVCGRSMININNRLTQQEFIERGKSISNLSFDKTEYKSKREKIIVTCNIHGDYETNAEMILKGCGCPICNISKGETTIGDYLKKINIEFETQKSFKDLKYMRRLKFDFYLFNHNILIEFDGEQHFKSVDYWGGEKSFKDLQLKDMMKNEYCRINNIPLLRIKYSDTDITSLIDNFIKNNSCI